MSTKETRERKIPVNPAVRTRQEPKDSTDINKIVSAARRGTMPTWINRRAPIYADMTEVPKDLTQAYMKIQAAREAFDALPSDVRRDIDHDPLRLPQWLHDPKNREIAEKYGLVEKAPEEALKPPLLASPVPKEDK